MSALGHGDVGKREQRFTELLSLRAASYDITALAKLAEEMKGPFDTVKDGPDPEENLFVPAGYTYFGQFIDHDLTFDSSSSLDFSDSSEPGNFRTPRFDLDCVYGDGPDAQPFLYEGDKLLYKKNKLNGESAELATEDLARNVLGRAIIGDKRNDENSIVSQLQLGFIKFHNEVVFRLSKTHEKAWNTPGQLFTSARNEVRWAYQYLIVNDFLPRIVRNDVLADLHRRTPDQRAKSYALFTDDKRGNLPREFVAAAYRYGHSGVRTGYRMNSVEPNRFNIFPASNDPTIRPGSESLLGFDPMTENQIIDSWERFFPYTLPLAPVTEDRKEAVDETPRGKMRLQFAYKIDTSLVDPLGALPRSQVAGEETTRQAISAIAPARLPETAGAPQRPSLALLNLLRGNSYRISGGQAFALKLAEKGFPCAPLSETQLVIRKPVADKDGMFQFVPIPEPLRKDTPLWFYILAEAQAPIADKFKFEPFEDTLMLTGVAAETQLGWVGGRIVAEVFYGLLDADPESYVNAAPIGWAPIFGDKPHVLRSLLEFAAAVKT